ncbi:MAG: DNA polymerase III subunit chi [Burkholderiales bacterium PBB5]|nr:MAG: DNA polymerase III subunit chi [Burkholderiales bacterium PBB5]
MGREVEFHIGLSDKPDYACRLLRKAQARGIRVVVTGAPEALARLDSLLWTFDPGEFIPHARLRAGQAIEPVLARTPIWLADQASAAGAADVLVNLGPGMPDQHEGFGRVVELVAVHENDAAAGRQRWRQYKAAGHTPRDMRQGGASASATA